MDPVKHSSHNFVFKGPTPDIGDLSCCRGETEDGYAVTYSHWRPTEQELQALLAGGSVRLGVFGSGHPPVSLEVDESE